MTVWNIFRGGTFLAEHTDLTAAAWAIRTRVELLTLDGIEGQRERVGGEMNTASASWKSG